MSTRDRPDRRQARVPPEGAGRRLDHFLVQAFPRYSRRKISAVIRRGEVLVNDQPARPGTVLSEGDRLDLPVLSQAVEKVERDVRRRGALRQQALPSAEVEVLYRDDDLLVVSKPPGVPVHGGAELGATATLVDLLKADVLRGFGLVHRIDRDTSGCVALVRGDDLRAKTSARFAEDEGGVEKLYEAIVEGVPDPAEGRIDLALAPPGHRGRAEVDAEGGKPSLTLYRTVETFEDVARLEVEPVTGRTHQIRAHLAAIGHPLLVDPLYGNRGGWLLRDPRGRLDARLRRTPLHAASLTLPHPRTGEPVTVRAPLPGDMRYALEVLRVEAGKKRKTKRPEGS